MPTPVPRSAPISAPISAPCTDLSLTYRLRPAVGAPAGLVLLLHGVGANETSLAGLADFLPADLCVALVRSPFPLGHDAYCAFPVHFTTSGPVIDAAAAETSRQKLADFTRELQAKTAISPNRTLVAGFSQGGIMAASLALTAPADVRGFAVLSGRILPEIADLIAPPTALARLDGLIVHGERDDKLPIAWAEKATALLGERGVRHTVRRYPAGHELTQSMAEDFRAWAEQILPNPQTNS